jgi:hypothetical protein
MTDDKTPPEITTGSFVSWSGGKGRVDLVVSKGTVPGVTGDPVEATSDSPAARVTVWKDGKATREKIAASTHTLKRITPLAAQAAHEQHVEDARLPASARVSVKSAQTAYERGFTGWPGQDATTMSPEEWAIGRVMHLMKVALLERHDTNDTDLLDPTHPDAASGLVLDSLFDEGAEGPAEVVDPEAVSASGADDVVEIDAADLEASFADIEAASAMLDEG